VLNGHDDERLEATRAAMAARTGGAVHAVAFDVTDPDAVESGVAAIEELVGTLDILVNNVGTQHRATLVDFPDQDWYRLIDTNLTSAFLVGRAVARRMAPRGAGKIVNIVSLQSEVARPGIAPYAATKGALKMLTKGMCADLAPAGIQVNAIGPGYIATELTSDLMADPDFDAWVRGRTPAGRWGEPADLVGPLLFLCSPAADFVTGQILYVDGGVLAVL
jgi:gluconate 5-dehydrogenase